MAENKKSFILYADLIHTVKKMNENDVSDLFIHILEYVNDENPKAKSTLVDLVFEPIKQQLKRDLLKWDQTKIVRAKTGKIGGLKSGIVRKAKSKTKQIEANEANEAIALKSKQTKQIEANEAVNVNVIPKGITYIPKEHPYSRLPLGDARRERYLNDEKYRKEIDYNISNPV